MARVSEIFPRSTERGPIEAIKLLAAVFADDRFPRSTERGPIEASFTRSATRRQTTFRVQQNAAPLKLDAVHRRAGGNGGFPRSTERGPIEANNAFTKVLAC